MNQVICFGNLTADPELTELDSGTKVCNFSVATNRKWKNADGELKEEATFFNWVAWGRQAEIISEYMKKGQQHLFRGRVQVDQWVDPDTDKNRYATKFVVEEFSFGRNSDGQDSKPSKKQETKKEEKKKEEEPTWN